MIDYKELLLKYVMHVKDMNSGYSFIDSVNDAIADTTFSDEEEEYLSTAEDFIHIFRNMKGNKQ